MLAVPTPCSRYRVGASGALFTATCTTASRSLTSTASRARRAFSSLSTPHSKADSATMRLQRACGGGGGGGGGDNETVKDGRAYASKLVDGWLNRWIKRLSRASTREARSASMTCS